MGQGTLLWQPSAAVKARANLTRYMAGLGPGASSGDYHQLWRWSVEELEAFWASIWDFGGVAAHRGYHQVLSSPTMPGANWFAGAELNYAGHALRHPPGRVAVVARSETRGPEQLTYGELAAQVGAAAAGLRRLGVGRGDRVAAYLPNTTEAVVAFLATASLGAVWSSASPEMGAPSVVDRFAQIEPKVLVAVDGYRYAGVDHDRSQAAAAIASGLASLAAVVTVGYLRGDRGRGGRSGPARSGAPRQLGWAELVAEPEPAAPVPVAFAHPLWVLYSSGTTGPPKAIVHGHGGMLLEHLKYLSLHADLGVGDRFFWFTTTGWMMWNLLMGGLLVGATIVVYDGSPTGQDGGALWRLAEETGVTYFGTSASYLLAQRRAGAEPARHHDLSAIRSVGSTGSPLPAAGFEWTYQEVGDDLVLGSVSGGTDVCTAFVASCPLLPVHAGECQCRALGAAVEVFDGTGHPVVGKTGELVLSQPMPCMPLGLWGDIDHRRYREAYFATFPGVWRHGDWAMVTRRHTVVIAGRSDATLNRGGLRTGTAELYRVVEGVEGIDDSLAVDTGGAGVEGKLVLLVAVSAGRRLDDALRAQLATAIRSGLSPRHVPDVILQVPEVPRTLSGKLLEVPVKAILAGARPADVVDLGAVANPAALDAAVDLAAVIGLAADLKAMGGPGR